MQTDEMVQVRRPYLPHADMRAIFMGMLIYSTMVELRANVGLPMVAA
jgi:hypothetical protein